MRQRRRQLEAVDVHVEQAGNRKPAAGVHDLHVIRSGDCPDAGDLAIDDRYALTLDDPALYDIDNGDMGQQKVGGTLVGFCLPERPHNPCCEPDSREHCEDRRCLQNQAHESQHRTIMGRAESATTKRNRIARERSASRAPPAP